VRSPEKFLISSDCRKFLLQVGIQHRVVKALLEEQRPLLMARPRGLPRRRYDTIAVKRDGVIRATTPEGSGSI